MPQISSKVLQALDWSKIQDFLSEQCVNELGRNFASQLQPFQFDQEHCDQMALASIELLDLFKEKSLRIPLMDIVDLSHLFKRIERSGTIFEEEFAELVRTHKSVQNAAFFVEKYAKGCRSVTALVGHLHMIPDWADQHFSMIDQSGQIADSASPDLRALRKLKKNIEKEIREILEDKLKRQSFKEFLQDDYITLREGRFVLPVKSNFKGRVSGIIHDLSKTEQTIFLEPSEVVELNNKLKMVEKEILLEIERILHQVVLDTKPYLEEFWENQGLVSLADFLNASSLFLEQLNTEASCVQWREGRIQVEAIRHPILGLNEKVVPNSLSWEKGLVLTGPNTGGKTVLLKSIGLAYCMARSGLPICAKKVVFPPSMQNVFVDIGDDQSIHENLSTFSAHLKLYKEMLDSAQPDDLILIDEIATGTDPEEGANLAKALFEEFLIMETRVLVTTHYGNMKHFAMSDSRCRIAAMAYDWQNKKPTFDIQMDIPGESSALDTAERLGIKIQVIDRAKQVHGTDSKDLESAVKRLESSRNSFLEKTQELEQKLKEAQSREREAQNLLQSYRKKIKETVQEEAKKLLKEFASIKDKLSQRLKNISSSGAEKDSFELFEEISQQSDKLKSLSRDEAQDLSRKMKVELEDLKVGMAVEIAGLGGGIVEELPAGSQKNPLVTVKVGSLKTRVQLERLFLPSKAKLKRISEVKERKKVVHPSTFSQDFSSRTASGSSQKSNGVCDVRGRSLDDAMRKIEASLNDLSRGDLINLSIIHGHGTGTLKERIRSYFRSERPDLSFRSGSWPGEGGDGVTIVELSD